MNEVLEGILTDLEAESAQLDGWVGDLDATGWATNTTAEGWTVAHQIAHLAWTDQASLTAVTDAKGFAALGAQAAANPTGFVDEMAEEWSKTEPGELLRRWRAGRAALVEALRAVPQGQKVPWFGPPMSPNSMATARMMETWAHARDVAGALDVEAPRTPAAKHVAYLGVRTRDFAYTVRGEEAPEVPVRVELTGPDGGTWAWGPEDAEQLITGDGYDFALIATRRLHPDDAKVTAHGDVAAHWLKVMQAFAGLPGTDPQRKAA